MNNLLLNYVVYVIYFLGMGLVSSGIVLMPFNGVRYSIILTLGLSLFLTGALLTEFLINKNKATFKSLSKLIFLSLTLAIGIGMISGGISHFRETPTYVSYLIPLGIIISSLSFTFKNNYTLSKKDGIKLSILILVIALTLHLGLSHLADGAATNGGDIFNSMEGMH